MNDKKLKWLLNSRAYQKASKLVSATISSPQQLLKLVDNAQAKISSNDGSKLAEVLESARAAFRLLKAYAGGQYRDISPKSLTLIVASIIYFVMPIDVLPDFILGFGLTDDAALLAWTFRSVVEDVERFIKWEMTDNKTPDDSGSSETMDLLD
jgi:uncharacterized membrane protein YkvA (DUF1232 family)